MTPRGVFATLKRAFGASVGQWATGVLPSDTFRVATVKLSIRPLVASHARALGCEESFTTSWRTSASVSERGGSGIFSASTSGPVRGAADGAGALTTGAVATMGARRLRFAQDDVANQRSREQKQHDHDDPFRSLRMFEAVAGNHVFGETDVIDVGTSRDMVELEIGDVWHEVSVRPDIPNQSSSWRGPATFVVVTNVDRHGSWDPALAGLIFQRYRRRVDRRQARIRRQAA